MRRSIDVVAALTALVIVSPVLLLVALVVFADSPGSPLHGGWRIGRNGAPFRMWKFRTMVANADQGASVTGKNDPRVTWVGRVLPNAKIDELVSTRESRVGRYGVSRTRGRKPPHRRTVISARASAPTLNS